MANQNHLELLKKSISHWNEWRKRHQEIEPDFYGADLSGVNLSGANLSGADFRRANFREADLYEATLRGADFSGACLSGVDLRKTKLRRADFTITDLSYADLDGVDLRRAVFKGANLLRANLQEVNLWEVNLSGSNLREANLTEANLSGANLSNADLSKARLWGARLWGVNLWGVDLNKARVGGTIFAYINLCETKGLGELQHLGPSFVQLYTVQLPQDGSALHFLRGAGVPEEWIVDYRSHMMHPIQYHSLFISYSSKDDMLARRLHADLQAKGVRCWFAPEDMKIGDRIRTRINEAIHVHEKLLLLLSEHAIGSAWVEDEVEAALEKEQRQQREVLFPIRLDESVMQTSQAWAAKLRRSRHIGDFTCWIDPQVYQQSFERLLRDLHK